MSIPFLLLARYRALGDQAKLIAIIGRVKISTYANLNFTAPAIQIVNLDLQGNSEDNTYTISNLTEWLAIKCQRSFASSESYTDVMSDSFSAVVGKSTVELTTTDTNSITDAFFAAVMDSITTMENHTEAEAIPATADKCSANIPIKLYTLSDAYVCQFKYIIGQAVSETNINIEELRVFVPVVIEGDAICETNNSAEGQIFTVAPMSGVHTSDTFAITNLDAITPKVIDAIAECLISALGNSRPFSAKSSDGNGASDNNAEGNIILWGIPILENNTLKIVSAYGASVTDGILEVI